MPKKWRLDSGPPFTQAIHGVQLRETNILQVNLRQENGKDDFVPTVSSRIVILDFRRKLGSKMAL